MYKLLTIFFKFFINKILFRTKYINLEILDNYPKCIICSNHSRVFDPAFLFPKIENMYSVAKSEIFEHKLFGDFLAYNGAIPIKRNSIDRAGIQNIINLLNEKRSYIYCCYYKCSNYTCSYYCKTKVFFKSHSNFR